MQSRGGRVQFERAMLGGGIEGRRAVEAGPRGRRERRRAGRVGLLREP